jgi:hypothetical protein
MDIQNGKRRVESCRKNIGWRKSNHPVISKTRSGSFARTKEIFSLQQLFALTLKNLLPAETIRPHSRIKKTPKRNLRDLKYSHEKQK